MFALQNVPHKAWSLSGLEPLPGQAKVNRAAKFDLTLMLTESDEGLTGMLEYATDLFKPSTIARMVSQFECLLDAIVAQPECQLSELPLLDRQASNQLVDEFAPGPEVAMEGLFNDKFEAICRAQPDAIAIEIDDLCYSYQQLNEQSNRLAHHLISLGVAPENKVGICIERSFNMVVAILAILKAGGAYVPLGAANPDERLNYMLEDAQVSLVMTSQKVAILLPEQEIADVLILDSREIETRLGELPCTNPTDDDRLATLHKSHPAYLVYTSGSTGEPKGPLNTHEGLLNLLGWIEHKHQLGSTDKVLQKAAFNFDGAVYEIFLPLISGATLVLALPGEHVDAQAVLNRIQKHGVTDVLYIPTLLEASLPLMKQTQCPSLKRIYCVGEALKMSTLKNLSQYSQATVCNLYGPTEAAMGVCDWTHEAQPIDLEQATRNPPIGKPVDNTRLYVLDQNQQLCPIGVEGELYIAGTSLARGYYNQPGLTALSYMPCPYGKPGARMYKTRDKCRWSEDGEIEFIGRVDTQVKLRGFRIELAEVEAALLAQPSVAQATVMVRADNDIQQLVAYCVPHETLAPVAALRKSLALRLPEYMLPSMIVSLDSFPLRPNGKISFVRLPVPGSTALALHDYEQPQGQIEETIVSIWQELLNVHKIGRNDHFFDLGGHSMMIPKLMWQMDNAGLEVEVTDLFENPTVRGFAECVYETEVIDDYDDVEEVELSAVGECE
jgi:amino acid adenylation domain-containing protein